MAIKELWCWDDLVARQNPDFHLDLVSDEALDLLERVAFGDSLTGKTTDSDSVDLGSTPSP